MTERLFEGIKSKTFEGNKKVTEELDWSNKTILIAEDEDVNFVYLETAYISDT